MRILFLINSIPPDYGGGYLRVFRTASRFKQYGWFYKVATYTKSERYNEILDISNDDIFFLSHRFIRRFFELSWKMIKHSSDYDVLYIASATRYTVLPALIAKMQHKTVVSSVTLSMVDSPALPPSNAFKVPYYWYKNIQFKIADYVFVNSPLLVEECVNCGLRREKVKLINNPVDIKKFHPVSENERCQLRKEHNLPKDNLTILFVGSINKRKGCDIFPVLFEQLFTQLLCKITFIMCGQKGYPETDDIITKLESLFNNYQNKFVVKEEVKDPSRYYQMADIFLFPTTNEGMPNVVLEAMSSGCMILSNTLPGITDYVLDDMFLVRDNNVNEYVKCIINYFNDKKKYEVYIMKNRKVVESSFSIDAVDCTIKKMLNSTLKTR